MDRRAQLRAAIQEAASHVRALRQAVQQSQRQGRDADTNVGRHGSVSLLSVAGTCLLLAPNPETATHAFTMFVANFLRVAGRGVARQLTEAMNTVEGSAMRDSAAEALPAVQNSKWFRRVALLVAERCVLAWLGACNARGAAVHRSLLVEQLRANWPAAGRSAASVLFLHRLNVSPARATKWALQFRRRWQVSWRRLPARPLVLHVELVEKALRAQKLGQKMVPFLGPFLVLVFGTT